MDKLRKIKQQLGKDLAERYVLFVLVAGLPISVGLFHGVEHTIFWSFVIQAIIGILYLRKSE